MADIQAHRAYTFWRTMLMEHGGESAGPQSLLSAESNAEETVCEVGAGGCQVSVPGQRTRCREGTLVHCGAKQAVATVHCMCTAWRTSTADVHMDRKLRMHRHA